MATSIAQICNKGLARIGVTEYLTDLSKDQSTEADTCNVLYEDLRDACLAEFAWPFASLRKTLVEKLDEPARDGWRKIFTVPAGCLKPRKIWPAGTAANSIPAVNYNPRAPRADQRIPFVIEKSSIDDSPVLLCDLDSPVLFYTARVVDPTRFPPKFVDAFAYLLASELAMPLTKDPKKASWAEQQYVIKIREAWADALSTGQPDTEPDVEAIVGRL